jgi:hypothetical protein
MMSQGARMRVLWLDSTDALDPERTLLVQALRQYIELTLVRVGASWSMLRDLGKLLQHRAQLIHTFGSSAAQIGRFLKWRQPSMKLLHQEQQLKKLPPLLVPQPASLSERHSVSVPCSSSVAGVCDPGITNLASQWPSTTDERKIPPHSLHIVALGNLAQPEPLRRAIWAFDVLRHTDPRLQLVIPGTGPARPWLENFAHKLSWDDRRVHFTDKSMSLTEASICWNMDSRRGEALALRAAWEGCPMLAMPGIDLTRVMAHCPDLEILESIDPLVLAKRTKKLLENHRPRKPCPDLADRFSLQKLVQEILTSYDIS